jgi:Tol biopolymer transport system component
MRKLHHLFLVATALCLMVFGLTGCAKKDSKESSLESPIKGKLAVYSFREGNHVNDSALYLVNGSEIKKISDLAGDPVWSPDGSKILASDQNGNSFAVYDENGTVLKKVTVDSRPFIYDWFPSQDKIIYVGREKLNEKWDSICRLFVYDLVSDTQQEIYAFEENQYIYDLHISPDGNKVAFFVSEALGKKARQVMGALDLNTLKVREYKPVASVLGWLPDGKYFIISTNIKEDGTKFNQGFGILGKINIETGNFEIIHNLKGFYLDAKVSKDGKYIYYVRGVDGGGAATFIQSIESQEEFVITTPILVQPPNGYSHDFSVSWYQGD